MAKGKTFTVLTPNKFFSGEREGVYFKDGKGQADKETAQRLVNFWGYNCPELTGDEPESAGEKKLSKDVTPWQDAVTAVEQIESAEEIEAFIEGDDRKSVQEAAAARIEELAAGEEETQAEDAPEQEDDDTPDDEETLDRAEGGEKEV